MKPQHHPIWSGGSILGKEGGGTTTS